jgi:flagellin
MSLNISTNTAALRAGAYLSSNNALLQRSLDRLASGKKLTTPVEDPGGLAVSMKLSSAINRVTGAQNNVQNAISFLEVQDGMLDTVGKIIDRMSELKGLASADPMKSEQDKASYNNEFKDLQAQLHSISQQKFNGVSLFAEFKSNSDGTISSDSAVFGAQAQDTTLDKTMTIYTSSEGSAGSKVSLNSSLLLSALTFSTSGTQASVGYAATANASVGNTGTETGSFVMTLAVEGGSTAANFLDLQDISVGVLTKALENISFLRAQNGGTHSRLAFNLDSLSQQKTNMRAALGRIVDVDIAEESTNLAKYSILNQAAASMLAQANASSDVALMLLR